MVSRLKDKLNINLTVVDAADRFLNELEGVTDPEIKRKTIGRLFIEVFQEEAHKIEGKVRVDLMTCSFDSDHYLHCCIVGRILTTRNFVSRCHRVNFLQRSVRDDQDSP